MKTEKVRTRSPSLLVAVNANSTLYVPQLRQPLKTPDLRPPGPEQRGPGVKGHCFDPANPQTMHYSWKENLGMPGCLPRDWMSSSTFGSVYYILLAVLTVV
ncbi:hypothetical protein DPEC_G00173620 [Dallia pectoralis]|uniref:Uncharacterized protein n=1 Tax=Dallia pectoralis TaxID=75939 RepID=A0ACC2GDN4_DALPE|nr:hypothetical protein DPEC_G00173620 [Dallia pectoralis]